MSDCINSNNFDNTKDKVVSGPHASNSACNSECTTTTTTQEPHYCVVFKTTTTWPPKCTPPPECPAGEYRTITGVIVGGEFDGCPIYSDCNTTTTSPPTTTTLPPSCTDPPDCPTDQYGRPQYREIVGTVSGGPFNGCPIYSDCATTSPPTTWPPNCTEPPDCPAGQYRTIIGKRVGGEFDGCPIYSNCATTTTKPPTTTQTPCTTPPPCPEGQFRSVERFITVGDSLCPVFSSCATTTTFPPECPPPPDCPPLQHSHVIGLTFDGCAIYSACNTTTTLPPECPPPPPCPDGGTRVVIGYRLDNNCPIYDDVCSTTTTTTSVPCTTLPPCPDGGHRCVTGYDENDCPIYSECRTTYPPACTTLGPCPCPPESNQYRPVIGIKPETCCPIYGECIPCPTPPPCPEGYFRYTLDKDEACCETFSDCVSTQPPPPTTLGPCTTPVPCPPGQYRNIIGYDGNGCALYSACITPTTTQPPVTTQSPCPTPPPCEPCFEAPIIGYDFNNCPIYGECTYGGFISYPETCTTPPPCPPEDPPRYIIGYNSDDCCPIWSECGATTTIAPCVDVVCPSPQVPDPASCICVDPPGTSPPPTTLPPSTPFDCDNPSNITINGYAYYFSQQSSVSLAGRTLTSPCWGGHCCDRGEFMPYLILQSDPSIKIAASNSINMDNLSDGGNRFSTFSFNLANLSRSEISQGLDILLDCVEANQNCHNGVTWVVLTSSSATGTEEVIFSECVVPGSLEGTGITCRCGDTVLKNESETFRDDSPPGDLWTEYTYQIEISEGIDAERFELLPPYDTMDLSELYLLTLVYEEIVVRYMDCNPGSNFANALQGQTLLLICDGTKVYDATFVIAKTKDDTHIHEGIIDDDAGTPNSETDFNYRNYSWCENYCFNNMGLTCEALYNGWRYNKQFSFPVYNPLP